MSTDVDRAAWRIERGDGAIVAAAVHDGGDIRPEIAERIALDERRRRHEEDPYTSLWTVIAPTRIVGCRSRFEVDLNRPREKAVYLVPEDAWGLSVWKEPLPPDVVEHSLAIHDGFYAEVRRLLEDLIARHGRVVVFDLHSYNHRRGGPDAPHDDPQKNPEINIGTGTMHRPYWGRIVDRLIDELRSFDYLGRRLDVRENVRFFGGYFPRWIHETFPETVCAPAIEVKKFFMDEWTGQPDPEQIAAVRQALAAAVAGVLEELKHFR